MRKSDFIPLSTPSTLASLQCSRPASHRWLNVYLLACTLPKQYCHFVQRWRIGCRLWPRSRGTQGDRMSCSGLGLWGIGPIRALITALTSVAACSDGSRARRQKDVCLGVDTGWGVRGGCKRVEVMGKSAPGHSSAHGATATSSNPSDPTADEEWQR